MEKKYSLEGITFKPFKMTDMFFLLTQTWVSCWMEFRDYFLSGPIKNWTKGFEHAEHEIFIAPYAAF